jgi:hypothetical protein
VERVDEDELDDLEASDVLLPPDLLLEARQEIVVVPVSTDYQTISMVMTMYQMMHHTNAGGRAGSYMKMWTKQLRSSAHHWMGMRFSRQFHTRSIVTQ